MLNAAAPMLTTTSETALTTTYRRRPRSPGRVDAGLPPGRLTAPG